MVLQYVEEKGKGFTNTLEWITLHQSESRTFGLLADQSESSLMMERVRRLVTGQGEYFARKCGG